MQMQRAIVRYRDGHEQETTLTQYGLSQFALWSQRNGITFDVRNNKDALMGIAMLRYQCYAELFFDHTSKTRPTFEVWDQTVIEVETISEQKMADPTQADTSGN